MTMETEGRSDADEDFQGHVHRRAAGAGQRRKPARCRIETDGGCGVASIAKAGAEPAPRETKAQSKRLQSILQNHGAKLRAHTDQAMEALINETEKMLSLLEGDDLRDAGLIASLQKLEHYEIAAYGTAAALAGQLELRDDQRMLHDSLEEE